MAAAVPDATLVVEETEVVVASEVVEEANPEEKKPEKVPKEKKVKAPKEKKPKKPKAPKATKVPTAHPPYLLVHLSFSLSVSIFQLPSLLLSFLAHFFLSSLTSRTSSQSLCAIIKFSSSLLSWTLFC
jgi:hypothetical protein